MKELISIIAKSGFEITNQASRSITINRDDARGFELALIQRKAEKLGIAYETVGARVISRRRVGRGVFEQVDHSTYTGTRFSF
jgi:hypothetical protein